MSIKIGTSDVTDIKIGTTNVNTVYIGSTVIWQRGSVYSYALSLGLTYSTGTYILASGTRTATLTVTRKTYINSVYQSELDQLVDADSVTFTYEPSGTDFSATRTSVGTYTISAQSRGTTVSIETDATIRVNYTPSGASQIYETTTVSQEANTKGTTPVDSWTETTISLSTSYTDTYASAAGASWTATATGKEQDYVKYQYTSLEYVTETDGLERTIQQSLINITVDGTGLSGSGNGAGNTLSWADRGTTPGSIRSGTVTATYNTYTDSKTVYQEANAVVSSTNYVITTLYLDDVNGNIEISSDADSIHVTGGGTYTKTYTSGSTAQDSFSLGASDISVSGTGFNYSNFYITVSENTGDERYCTVTGSYSGATSVQRTITQAAFVVQSPELSIVSYSRNVLELTMKCTITDDGGATITENGFEWGYTSALGNTAVATTVQSGEFSKAITVNKGTTVYFRAYATNSAGTTYTSQASVSIPNTPSLSLGTPTWQSGIFPYGIVTLKADISSNGGADITQYGFTYSASSDMSDPTTVYANNLSSGNFSYGVTWEDVTYIYYKAFATNEIGTTETSVGNYRHV